MLATIKDNEGNIQAVCEFNRVNPTGQNDKNGNCVYINNIEVNKNLKGKNIFKQLFPMIYQKVKGIQFVYFKRPKYRERIRLYRVEQFTKHLKELA